MGCGGSKKKSYLTMPLHSKTLTSTQILADVDIRISYSPKFLTPVKKQKQYFSCCFFLNFFIVHIQAFQQRVVQTFKSWHGALTEVETPYKFCFSDLDLLSDRKSRRLGFFKFHFLQIVNLDTHTCPNFLKYVFKLV